MILLGHQHTWNSLIIIIKYDSPQVAKYLNNNRKTGFFSPLKSVFIKLPIIFPLLGIIWMFSCQCKPTPPSGSGEGLNASLHSHLSQVRKSRQREKEPASSLTAQWALTPGVLSTVLSWPSHRPSRILMKIHRCHVEAEGHCFRFTKKQYQELLFFFFFF